MSVDQTCSPRVCPDVPGAFSAGQVAYPHGDREPPNWWPYGQRQAYADGWWHSLWNANGQSDSV